MNQSNQKVFEVRGTVLFKKQEKSFSRKTTAFSQKHAVEKILTLFGSQNRLKRQKIKITKVTENA